MFQGEPPSPIKLLVELRESHPDLKRTMTMQSFRAGQVLDGPATMQRNLFALAKGRVRMNLRGSRKRQVCVATLSPGAMFGDGIWSTSSERPVTAIALTDCVAWVLPAQQARELVRCCPALSMALLRTDGERLAQVEARMEQLAYQRLPARLAGMLLDLSDGQLLLQGISHQTLADMLGTYRETISAMLGAFCALGLVELGYRRIALRDPAGLRLAATGLG